MMTETKSGADPRPVEFTPKRIILPIGGRTIPRKAAELACRIARREGAVIHAMTVVEVPRGLPITDVRDEMAMQADEWLADIKVIAKKLEVQCELVIVQSREAGPAIVDEAESWDADLIVLGVPYREKFEEFQLGKTAAYILHHAACQVLMLRDWADEAASPHEGT